MINKIICILCCKYIRRLFYFDFPSCFFIVRDYQNIKTEICCGGKWKCILLYWLTVNGLGDKRKGRFWRKSESPAPYRWRSRLMRSRFADGNDKSRVVTRNYKGRVNPLRHNGYTMKPHIYYYYYYYYYFL